jgi:hypothetical protein
MGSPRQILASALEQGLFAALNLERKIETCQFLLKIAARDTDVVCVPSGLLYAPPNNYFSTSIARNYLLMSYRMFQ